MATRTVLPFKPPARRRLHEDVADQLRDAILDGRFPAGRRLPPERELAIEFAVNRTSIRDAIKVLEGLGLVVVRQGDGARVQPLVDASLDVLGPMIFHGGKLDFALLGEMHEIIVPLLLEMGRLAIERRTPADLVRVRALRDAIGDTAATPAARYEALHELLVVLADMTRNRAWQMLGRRVRAFLQSEPIRAARQRLGRDPGRFVPWIEECLSALDGGRACDAVGALQQLITQVGLPLRAAADARQHPRPRGARS